ncbi:MAG TPA: methylamine utilization protein [Steroidobacteraceae bacterium]|jgi:plastocyanin|nr:methylamine utilization protein [Steroidobacteraceae bacterium]
MRKRSIISSVLLCFSAVIARAGELHVVVKDHRGKAVADAVVLAVPADPRNDLHARPPAEAVDQVDKQFVPYVKVIFVGSTVRFPNSDNIRHQVYSFSPAKKFELPLYARTDAPPVTFDKPGVVVLGCNIHDWMIGYVYVSETPFFAKTGPAGTATLSDMPPGEYAVRIWHPSMDRAEETTSRHVILAAEPAGEEWQLGLKPNIRVPRVSGAASPSYP